MLKKWTVLSRIATEFHEILMRENESRLHILIRETEEQSEGMEFGGGNWTVVKEAGAPAGTVADGRHGRFAREKWTSLWMKMNVSMDEK